ncbi:MAG: HNH nuclease family protein [Gammaproteobacteria bacterium]|nr:HNH nuclease family protein [Gammaproteobacteria bacterium]
MSPKESNKLDALVANARQNSDARERGYREQALKLYPWICGRCSREFTRENLKELTVHHRDHNHDYNPTDGSNWELLCVYCHDNEHSRHIDGVHGSAVTEEESSAASHNPFADLKEMLAKK